MEFATEFWTSLVDFWKLTADVLRDTAFGTSFGRLMLAVLLFGLLLVARGLFARFFVGWLKRIARRTRNQIDDSMVESLEKPLRFAPIVLGFFVATEILRLDSVFSDVALRVTKSLIVFTLFWGVIALVDPVSKILSNLRDVLSPTMVEWIIKALKILLGLIGAAAVLELWGVKIGPLIAGLGLFGLAGALAAQDLLKNLLSGVLILGEKRFHPGDWIKVDGVVEGTVETIGFRSTMVRQFDKAAVQVPNAKLADTAVINFSEMTHRRIYWKIGVLYDTSAAQLREIRDGIEAYIVGDEAFADPKDVATFVRIDSFNESSIDIMVYCFTKTTNWGEWLVVKEALAYRIKEIVEGARSGFAFPSRSLYVEALPGDAPEPFDPPVESSDTPSASAAVQAAAAVGNVSGDGEG
ncbi:MAG: mechanosensitive ion channel family protein [Rhodospirillaceae bacterium]|jgi:MscS family membrane protein|nr:mechanosensitive ion channel family protein [Rhodospirillaceae bacterium]MBT5945499.1 mechanosensitive ion channel family protein [Rhodospirillaceae bacterium]MBT6404229.1 mechanosensitive ion channel family protein [Rhodospirillaceae bacterium]MBT6535126.1 mechanosensitive ion channel family protein [Rhodospirillaceae bacterium]MBT7360732.1 mechanosensitive ion channel family protein [Rhodospirillaceae bacterium]